MWGVKAKRDSDARWLQAANQAQAEFGLTETGLEWNSAQAVVSSQAPFIWFEVLLIFQDKARQDQMVGHWRAKAVSKAVNNLCATGG